MGDASVSKGFLMLSGIVTVFCWTLVLLCSNILVFLYEKLGGFTSTPIAFAMLIPVSSGFYFAYAFFRHKFPDMEENKLLESDLMASLIYEKNANKRWFLWNFSILAGLISLALMIFASIILERNGFYLIEL